MTSANTPAVRNTAVARRPRVIDGVWWATRTDRATRYTLAAGTVVGLPLGVAAFTGHLDALLKAVGG